MKLFRAMLIATLFAGVLAAAKADEGAKGTITNTVGPMSENVIRERLKRLGYSDARITQSNPLRYRIEATKAGSPATLYFHPQTGQVEELGPEGRPSRAWLMPTEPVAPIQARPPSR